MTHATRVPVTDPPAVQAKSRQDALPRLRSRSSFPPAAAMPTLVPMVTRQPVRLVSGTATA